MSTNMDATELARWTRFAAKGGIGKCTAVQDCVAESPEDLMFLKDDEITVLMQLSNQPGYYLGYCEGVVGRFQGDHVRFHGKLKRPVMTRRASSSAVSAASSPVPSVTPSPRMPMSPLSTNSNSTPSPGRTLDRDSKALSDPFDLELDAPPPKARRSEDAASQNDSDGSTRRRQTRGAGDMSGFEMFVPRSRSGSRSRPSSRPPSRSGSAAAAAASAQAEDEKKTRRQTRIVSTPQQPQIQTESSRNDSLDVPPSPSVQSPSAQSPVSQQPSKSASPTSPGQSGEVQIKIEGEEKPRVSTSPEPMQPEPGRVRVESPVEKEESSLYDVASMRSSIYSTRSYRSSGGNGLSAAASDTFARLSRAESDDGGFGMGIGLSMLQDMADDDDEEQVGRVDAAPPTPRLAETHEEAVQKEAKEEGTARDKQAEGADEDESEEEYDEDDEDDGSYWDGADIYDSYRYSRFSMMTKNSRRKSRFSMISRNSFADAPGPKKMPPVPLDAETRLRADSASNSPVDASKDNPSSLPRKHVPPPLTFVKTAPSSSNALLSAGPVVSPSSTSNRSTTEFSDAHSPLLHTNFASPHSSSSQGTSFGTDEGNGDRRSLSPEPRLTPFAAAGPSANGNGGGAASALRQRLENEQSTSSTPLPSPMPVKVATPPLSAELKRQNSGVGGPGRGIVVDDDETVNVTVVPAEEGNNGSSQQQNIDHAKDNTARDSVQSAVSTTSSIDSTATSASGISDVSGVMRKIERDLASVSAFSGTGTSPSNIRSPLTDSERTPTPKLSDFAVGATTQPLRVQDRGRSPAPAPTSSPSPLPSPGLPDQSSNNHHQQIAHPPPSLQQQDQYPPVIQREAKPSQGPQLLRPEQSLFPPHPNAPRPNPAVLSGQRASTYGMPPVHEAQPQPAPGPSAVAGPPGMNLEATLRAASASRVGPAGVPHRQTIYGKTVIDLASADGPVAIVWSLSPFPLDPASRTNSPAPGAGRGPRRAATAGASPLSQSIVSNPPSPSPFPSPSPNQASFFPVTSPPPSATAVQTAFPIQAPVPVPVPAPAPAHPPSTQSSSFVSVSVSDNPTPTPSSNTNSTSNNNVLLRPNFQPRVGVARPRSRSFSDFSREIHAKPALKERPSEEGSRPTRVASVLSLKEAAATAGGSSRSASASGVNGGPLQKQNAANGNGSSPPKRSMHTPSPLSRPENNAVVGTPRGSSFSKAAATITPSSPLARSFLSSSGQGQSHLPGPAPAPAAAAAQGEQQGMPAPTPASVLDFERNAFRRPPVIPAAARTQAVRQVVSVDNFKLERPEQPLVGPPRSVLQPVRRNSGPVAGTNPPTAAPSAISAPSAGPSTTAVQNAGSSPSPVQRLRRLSSPGSKRHERHSSQQSQASSTSELRSATSPPPNAGNSSTPSPVQRSNSIKSKLSLSHLRIRHTAAKDSIDTQTPSPSTGPQTPVFDYDNQPETVQVQDAEFEMIRPTMRRISSEPMSDESAMGAADERPSLQQESIPESPISSSARSVLSPRPSTIADSMTEQTHTPPPRKSVEDAAAHRARELKWMQLMSTVPASQSRKSRKVRRLLLEGVPSSVRYLVWSHLTDSKARRIPGVYGQLGKRGRVAASEVIERDAARCFTDHAHLQDPKGPLVGLLQTYLTMVPDIEYQTSLTLLAGHLLLQSPEEDAFWIFTSMMDLHLRAYYSSKSVQMDADAMVLGKAVEMIHPQLAKKLFIDMFIPPLELCRMWFSCLYLTTLPLDYVNRIWDVYLFEGPPFLFRVALAILACCRSAIESSNDRSAVLTFLARPEMLSLLPEDPEEFLNLALAVKIKDDDVRKQRTKVEAELRQRTQVAHRSIAPRLVSSISLPRAGHATPL